MKLPDVSGKSPDDATAALNQAGFTVISTHPQYGPDRSKNATVISQDPTAGIAYDPKQQINLTIYRYRKPAPTCTSLPPTISTSTSTSPGAPSSPGTSSSSSSSSASTGSTLPPC